MALDNFIPTIWSNQLLMVLFKNLVFNGPNVVNRDYEGEIRDQGDTVKINSIGPVTISNYVKNTPIAAPQELVSAQTFMLIDQAKYWNFMVDDIDAVQGKPSVMAGAMRMAAYGMANVQDQYVAGLMVASAGSTLGSTGSPTTFTATTDAYNNLVNLGVLLDQANVPAEGRFAVVPPWYEGLMLKDDRFVRAPISSPNTDVIVNGFVGRAAGFDIMKSNNVVHSNTGAVGDYFQCVAGTNLATTVAEQIAKVEAFRPPDRFSDAVKGLHLYGAKVVRPEALGVLTVTRPSL